MPITAADLLNDRVVPFFNEHEIPLNRVLTDRRTEYSGRHYRNDYALYLAVEDIDHTKTQIKSPQTNGVCEPFHRTILDESRRKLYRSLEEQQTDSDAFLEYYNNESTLTRDGGASERRRCRPSTIA